MSLIKTSLITSLLLLFIACGRESTNTSVPIQPTPDIEATVVARIEAEKKLQSAIDAKVSEALAKMITPTPISPTPTPTPIPPIPIPIPPTPIPIPPTPIPPTPTPFPPTPISPTPTPIPPTPIPPTPTPTPTPIPTPTSIPTPTPDPVQVVSKSSVDAVVQIETDKGLGSGFIIRNDGLIITNYHVIKNSSFINVILKDGTVLTGQKLAIDAYIDLALIKINEKFLPYLKLGDSNSLSLGQKILIIGYPLGYKGPSSVTEGIISAFRNNGNELQTDAAAQPGNSGGPLLNLNGEVIGILTSKDQDAPQGMNYGIASKQAKPKIDRWIIDYDSGALTIAVPTPVWFNNMTAKDFYKKGREYLDSKDYDKAVEYLTYSTDKDPNYLFSYLDRAYIYSYKKLEYSKATDDLTKALSLDEKNLYSDWIYSVRAYNYSKQGFHTKAINDYTNSINLKPSEKIRYYNRGLSYRQLSQWKSAINDFTKAIKIYPNFFKAFRWRAMTYFDTNEYSKAIEDFDKAIDLNPNTSTALEMSQIYYFRGYSFEKLGQNSKAL